MLEKNKPAYDRNRVGGQLGRVLLNSAELSAAKCERFFGHTRARYFLMYLSAISAPGTSSEFDELDGKGGTAGRRENRSPMYVLTNLTGLKEKRKSRKKEKRNLTGQIFRC